MKLFSILTLTLAVAFSLTSCEKKHEPQPLTYSVIQDGNAQGGAGILTAIQDQPTTLRINLADQTIKLDVKWMLDGKIVSTDKVYTFTPEKLGENMLTVYLSNPDFVAQPTIITFNVVGRYAQGTFLLNEGNMTNENGRLLFMNDQNKFYDQAYYAANNSFLGNVAQDMFIDGQNGYVISQNGNKLGGDGLLVGFDMETLKKTVVYNEELKALSWPTTLAVVGKNIYIRDGKGVHLFNTDTKILTPINAAKRASSVRMAVVGNRVFVPAGANIFVIEEQKVDTIKFDGTISGIIKADGDNLWVGCNTRPATISKIDAKTLKVIQTNTLTNYQLSSGKSPAITAIADTLYFNNKTKINRHIFGANITEEVVDVATLVENANMTYCNIGVNPRTGNVYMATIKGYGMDYLINNVTVLNVRKSPATVVENYKNFNRFPAGFYFYQSKSVK